MASLDRIESRAVVVKPRALQLHHADQIAERGRDRIWFSGPRAAAYMDLSYDAFWIWQRRANAAAEAEGRRPVLVAQRLGRRLRFLKADLDRVLTAKADRLSRRS